MNDILTQAGLTNNQARVYRALLRLGEASMTILAREAQLKRPTAYLLVEELELLGLVSRTKKGKRAVYAAVHPRRLVQIARLRAERLNEVLPELVALYNKPKDKPKIHVFEGSAGVLAVYKELYAALSSREEARWFTRIDALTSMPEGVREYKRILRSLTNPKIKELNYDNKAGRAWLEEIGPLRGMYHEIRLLPPTYELGMTDTLIFGNKLAIFSLGGDVFVTLIESEEVAKSYRALFDAAWQVGQMV